MIEAILKSVCIIAVILVAFYGAYMGGLLTFTTHASVLYVGNIKRAKFSKCNGTFKRIIRFKESKSCRFELKQELTQGSLTVEILNQKKETLLTLDNTVTFGEIFTQERSRYYLVVKVKHASGNYELVWT